MKKIIIIILVILLNSSIFSMNIETREITTAEIMEVKTNRSLEKKLLKKIIILIKKEQNNKTLQQLINLSEAPIISFDTPHNIQRWEHWEQYKTRLTNILDDLRDIYANINSRESIDFITQINILINGFEIEQIISYFQKLQ